VLDDCSTIVVADEEKTAARSTPSLAHHAADPELVIRFRMQPIYAIRQLKSLSQVYL